MRDPNNAKLHRSRPGHTRKVNPDPPFMPKRRCSPAGFRLISRPVAVIIHRQTREK